VPEDRKTQGLFLELPIMSNVTVAILSRLTHMGMLNWRMEREHVEQMRRDLQIAMASPRQEVQFLSGGNQQKVVLAKWLETHPTVVILDEPTRGIDVGAKVEIYQLMRRLTDRGVSILMISSELTEVLGMSDRIVVMRDGMLVGEFPRAEATEEAIIALATTHEAAPEEAAV
jgi:ABC-type sugar transport system ATPase subunit